MKKADYERLTAHELHGIEDTPRTAGSAPNTECARTFDDPVTMIEFTELEIENARLKAALEWYADEANWTPGYDKITRFHTDAPIEHDNGKRARQALGLLGDESGARE